MKAFHELLNISYRTFVLIRAVVLGVLAYVCFYYAMWIGAELKDPVHITLRDIWPTLLILGSVFSIPRWDVNVADTHTRFSSGFTAYRSGGCISLTTLRILLGAGAFVSGTVWQIGIALHRFIAPLPHQSKPITTLPGVLLLIELLMLFGLAYHTFLYFYVAIRTNQTVGQAMQSNDDGSGGVEGGPVLGVGSAS